MTSDRRDQAEGNQDHAAGAAPSAGDRHWQHRGEPAVDSGAYHAWCADRVDAMMAAPIQRSARAGAEAPTDGAAAFASATAGTSSEVPYRAEMERSFGQDFGGVRAHLGSSTQGGLDALGASAAAQGDTVAFESAAPSKELVAHELTHVVQQRQGGASAPQGKATVSQPGDAAEAEADAVASKVAAGERVTVGGSAGPGIHRHIKGSGKVGMGEFKIDMTKVEEADFQGEEGTVAFTPSDKAPDSQAIKLTQSIKYFNMGTNADYDWTGSAEANRSKMNTKAETETVTTTDKDTLALLAQRFYGTRDRAGEIHAANTAHLTSDKPNDLIGAGKQLTIPKAVEGGYHVDHFPSDARAKPRTKASDKNVPQEYVWPGEENGGSNQHGSKKGKTIVPASLWDRPGWNQNMRYNFETVARSDETGTYFGGVTWGFELKDGHVIGEHHHVNEGVSHTFLEAVAEFNTFYKNKHTVMEGETLETLAERYFSDKTKADDIYNANRMKIPDKAKLAVGLELVIPTITATAK